MPPRVYAIFHRLVSGDEALFRLAQARFAAARLLPEYNPGRPDDLARDLAFHPRPELPASVHLPRGIRLSEPAGRDKVVAFASRFADRMATMVVHDQHETASRFDDYVAAVRDLNARLEALGPGPVLFIEYAAGIPAEAFVALFEAVRDCGRVSACVDISHVGIRHCQVAYGRQYPGEEITHLKWNTPGLRERVADVQAACAGALPLVVRTVAAIGRLGKPMHFHLHDGHPASTFNAFGVSDHLPIGFDIPIPFSHEGRRSLPPLFGPLGLRAIIAAARAELPDEKLTFTVEVHPTEGRLDLGEHVGLFAHWRDRGNAERMNYWVETLLRGAGLVRQSAGW